MFVTKIWNSPIGDYLYQLRSGLLFRSFNRAADFYFRMETRKHVDPENHGFDPAKVNAYVPSEWWALFYVLARLPISHQDVFVDLGCGKGRAMRIASAFSFKRIVGIDLIPSVVECAKKNLGYSNRFEVTQGNALHLPFPPDMTYVFAFNPFPFDTLLQVLDRLHKFAVENKRNLKFLYHSPVHHEIIMDRKYLVDQSAMYLPEKCLEEFRFYSISQNQQ